MAKETEASNPTSPDPTNRLAHVDDLTEEDMNEAMVGLGVKPEDLRDPAERTSYERYLARHNGRR